jgi:hypothetical protein
VSHSPDTPPSTEQPQQLSPLEVERLAQEGELLRVLRPNLRAKIERGLVLNSQAAAYVVQSNGEIYLSFTCISDKYQRQQAYQLIQRYQLGEPVDLSPLPEPLHHLIQPKPTYMERFTAALILGGVLGTLIGVLAMAISIQAIAATELITGTAVDGFANLQVSAIIFVIFSVVGWVVVTAFIWHKFRPHLPDQRNKPQNRYRRRAPARLSANPPSTPKNGQKRPH